MGSGSISSIGTKEVGINLNAVDNDTLTESYFAGAAQDMTERKKQVKSSLNTAQREVDGKRDKRIAELKKYVDQLTKGGFLKSFLKIVNFLTKIFSPITTLLDSVLGKVLKGKLAWLRTAITFIADIAQIFMTGGGSFLKTIADTLSKSLFQLGAKVIGKTISDAAMRIINLVSSSVNALSQSGIGILDSLKQKALATHQNLAEKFSLQALQANKVVEKNDDQLNLIKKQFARLLDTTRETINLQESARETLT